MSEIDTKGKFYIGRAYDLESGKTLAQPTLYDPDDLTTHGVVVGMTGSGKTGLCIDILEEAALQGIPALLIDPKGDIANLLLHFPSLSPQDFQPWVDPDQARREGKSVEEIASETAELWKNGLAKWGIGPERIESLRQAVDYAVYSPGSDAGFPVSILASLKAPQIPWAENKELLRDRISSTVTAILGLVGMEADPLRSREHILLANIFESAWKMGQDLDLTKIIRQIQQPPFDKLGAFEVNQFFPQEDRIALAIDLNSLLASPAFKAWTEGDSLDPEALLWRADGKPRHSVFYLAHLSDRERMFFVTLLLTAVESWMRTQSGSPSLRALIYFDEVLGFLPPVKEPPSKGPLLRLLKQARAFGLGLLLTTQNPVDIDYKGLSNAGTWFVGRLQTEQDKSRLLDGLESATADKGGFERAEVDRLISSLGKRVFLLHNVHEKAPQIFHTRWAMAYLKGPITRVQLRDLNAWVGAQAVGKPAEMAAPGERVSEKEALEGFLTRPVLPAKLSEFFLPNNRTVASALKETGDSPTGLETLGLLYHPTILAQARVRFLDRKANLDEDRTIAMLVKEPERTGFIRWEEHKAEAIQPESLDQEPAPGARFSDLEAPMSDGNKMGQLEKDFLDYVYRNAELRLLSNPILDLVAEPEMSEAEFQAACAQAARKARNEEIDKAKDKYLAKIKRLQDRLAREERELAEDETEHSARKLEEMATHFENVLGLFGGSRSRRRVSSSLTKRRMTSKAKADIEESQETIVDLRRDLEALEAEMAEEVEDIETRWEEAVENVEEKVFTPYKKDVVKDLFGIAWLPYWQLARGEERFELPGFETRK